MKKMETSCWFSTHDAFAAEFPEDYKKIWGNASLYYLKAEKYDDCVLLCERLLSQFPTLTAVYLQYADALFLLKKNNFAIYYQKYKENMQKEGKQKSIPKRVWQRLKKTK
jgi:hypothetical protein